MKTAQRGKKSHGGWRPRSELHHHKPRNTWSHPKEPPEAVKK